MKYIPAEDLQNRMEEYISFYLFDYILTNIKPIYRLRQ